MRILITILLGINFCHSQDNLSLESKKLLAIFQDLNSNIQQDSIWEDYLDIFPNNNQEFIKIFDPKDFSQLYSKSHSLISILKNAPKNKIEKVIYLGFDITKFGAPGCCDAWSSLHSIVLPNALYDPKTFCKILKNYKEDEINNILKFLADKEAIKYSADYQLLIDKFEALNEIQFAEKLKLERLKRSKEGH